MLDRERGECKRASESGTRGGGMPRGGGRGGLCFVRAPMAFLPFVGADAEGLSLGRLGWALGRFVPECLARPV